MAPLFLFYTCLVLDRYRMSELSVKNLLKNAHIYIYIYINHTRYCHNMQPTTNNQSEDEKDDDDIVYSSMSREEKNDTVPEQI
jgi:hypothetical protein